MQENLLTRVEHDGVFQMMVPRSDGLFLDPLPAFPIGTQDHFADVKAGFAIGIIDSNKHFIVLEVEARRLSERHQLIGGLSRDYIHDLIGDQNIFRALLGGGTAGTGERVHERMLRGDAVIHAHADNRATLLVFRSEREG